MQKKIFFNKNKKKIFYISFIFLFLIIIINLIIFYIIINQKYFVINIPKDMIYYIIPKDKEGEKVKFLNKKSINDQSIIKNTNINSNDVKNLKYTIQLLSDINYDNIKDYSDNLIKLKSEIIFSEELFIFSVNSEIGIDYFLTYKNFNSKNEAMAYCDKLSFVKKCLIINPQNLNF